MNLKITLSILMAHLLAFELLAQSSVTTSYGSGAGTGGTANAFFGGASGRVTTGTANTFIGTDAGYFNTTGSHNAFLGKTSGWFNTSGSNNVNIGDGAAYYNSTGSSNTAIGNGALWFNTSSSNNTALGNGAGYNALGSGNLFLGFNAGANETGSNKLYIANSNTNSPLIFGDFSTGNVAIGTLNPISKLEVRTNLPSIAVYESQNWSTDNLGYNFRLQTVWENSGINQRFVQRFNGTDYQVLSFSSGNVAIGKNTAAYKLDVNGAINATNFLINGAPISGGVSQWTTSGANINYATGNVGIGQSIPAYKLDVAGSINASSILINGQPFAGGGSQWATVGNTINYPAGNVGIGTTSPDAKLAVKGIVHASEVKVDLNVPGPDYVFENDYKLTPLDEIKTYIDQNKHLPEVPSAKEMEENGVNLGEMNMILLKKIEELTLNIIEMNERLKQVEAENQLKKRNKK